MIYGVGLDVVEIQRFEKLFTKNEVSFIKKIAHPEDLKHSPSKSAPLKRKLEYWASRFAVKEAFAKALGTGLIQSVWFNDIGVTKSKTGKPGLVLSSRLEGLLRKKKIIKSHISISHTAQSAIAVVVLEC